MNAINIKELAIDVGYSYLNGKYGYWEDGAGNIRSYDSMDNEYLENCINFVDKGIKEIKNDENGIIKDIKKQLSKMCNISSDKITDKELKDVKKQLVELLKEKKNELKDYMKERKSYKE